MKEWQRKSYDENALQYEGSPADVKHVWELNRHQYFVTLAQAFCVSGDRAYLDELAAQWVHWIRENPFRTGINWASPLEIGVRLISWAMAFQFVESHLSLKDRSAIVNSAWEQLSFLSTHLSLDKVVRTNHVIGEAAGLFIAASCFSFRECEKWKRKGQEILEHEMLSQVFEDGVAKEESSSYHRFDVDFFLISYMTGAISPRPFSARFKERLQKMIRYLSILRTPDNRLPVYGDCDNGRGFTLAPWLSPLDPRGIIAAGGTLLGCGEMPLAELLNEESFWLLSESDWDRAELHRSSSVPESFTILPDSRHVVIAKRDSGDYCFVRAGEFGMGGRWFSYHSHNDLFSPIISLSGISILADTGTPVYLGNDTERDYLRSAAAHNSTFSGSWNFFESKRGFGWKKCLNGTIRTASRTEKVYRVECGFDSASVDYYSRTIAYQADRRTITVEDLFTKNIEDIHSYFHLDRGLTAAVAGTSVLIRKSGKSVARCDFSGGLRLSIEDGWISESYGIKDASVILHFMWSAIAQKAAFFTFSAIE